MPVGDQAAPRPGVEVEDLALPAAGGRHLELRVFRPRLRPALLDVLVLVCIGAADAEELARSLSELLDRAVVLPRLDGSDPDDDAALLCVLLAWVVRRGGARGLRRERLSLAVIGSAADAVCAVAQRHGAAMLAAQFAARTVVDSDASGPPSAISIARLLALGEAGGPP